MALRAACSMVFAVVALMAGVASATNLQDSAKGFVEGSEFKVVSRNFYMRRDIRDGSYKTTADGSRQGYGEEWAQGFIANFVSGFTPGVVGFGVDAFGLAGVKLDSGKGRNGLLLLEVDKHGEAKDDYSLAGGAVKFQYSNTVMKYGRQMPSVPVFNMSDTRLLPESAEGLLVTSREIDNLKLDYGHFTALRQRNSSSHDSRRLPSIDFVGGKYSFSPELSLSAYYADTDEFFKKGYVNANYAYAIDSLSSLQFDLNSYRTKSEGQERAGKLDNTLWSLATSYKTGMHLFLLAYQQVTGVGAYYYGVDGGCNCFYANAMQLSDFNQQGEKSIQLRYDLNFAPLGAPGLILSIRHIRGEGIEIGNTRNGRENETDFDAKYVVQSGVAKDLSFRLRYAVRRSGVLPEMDELRLITEFPINIF